MATQLRTPYIFNPIDENAQRFLCSLVDLPLIFPHARKISKPLNKPIKLYNIIGDGNCLFRALSYIITGRQIYHMTVRHKILEHMRSIENLLLPHMNMSFSITRKDTLLQLAPSLKSVCFPADGVQSLQRFISCTKCQTKLLPDNSKKIVKCTECGLVQLKSKCPQRLLANTLFQNNGEATSLLLFDDKLKQLYEVYQGQTDDEKSFESLDDDSLMEFLLTVEATAHFIC